ncbi:MAG: hypothetical protein OHK005_07580 [Candidatus Methylacidiphilales bacterium]
MNFHRYGLLLGFFALTSVAFAAEIQILVVPKAGEAKKPELRAIPTSDLAEHLRPFQSVMDSRTLSLSSEATEFRFEWQTDQAQHHLTLRALLDEYLRFDLNVRSEGIKKSSFGSSAAPKESRSSGSLELPGEFSYLIDAGHVLMALAPAKSVPAAVEGTKITTHP